MNDSEFVFAMKDSSKEWPIPTSWRPVFRSIVNALIEHDYCLKRPISGVETVPLAKAAHIETYIKNYGETLVDLSEETWNSSVCIWSGHHWDVLVDLCTKEEGMSDLVLSAQVSELNSAFSFKINIVYVP